MANSLSTSGTEGTYSDEANLFVCDLCHYDNIVSEGVGFCLSCEEFLCDACLRAHKRSKLSKSHAILQGADLHKAKKSSVQLLGFEFCSLHKDRAVEFYCTDDDEVLCIECKSIDHRSCREVRAIDDACADADPGQKLQDLVNSTDLLVKKLEAVREERNADLNTLLAQREACLEDINTFRSKVNESLDRLENAFLKTLEETVKREAKIVKEHVTSLETAVQSLERDMKNFEAAKQHGNDGKMFIAIKKFAPEKMKKTLNDITDEKLQVDIRFVEDRVLLDVLANLQTLGQLQVNKRKSGPTGEQSSGGGNWVPAGNKTKTMRKQGETNIREPDDTNLCWIYGMACLPNGKLLMTDYKNHKLKLTDSDIKLESSIRIQNPYGVAIVSPREAVVTSVVPKKLQFVTLEPSLQLGRTVDVKRQCWGVAVCGEKILVSCHDCPGNGEVLVMDHQGAVQRRLGVRGDGSYMFTRQYCISVNRTGDKLYVSDSDNDSPTVTCLRLGDGATVYTYSGQEVKYPRSLLVDEEDNVFMCDVGLRHVQVITKDGTKYKTLLTKADGLEEQPRTLAYRKRDDTVMVGSRNSDVLQIYKFL